MTEIRRTTPQPARLGETLFDPTTVLVKIGEIVHTANIPTFRGPPIPSGRFGKIARHPGADLVTISDRVHCRCVTEFSRTSVKTERLVRVGVNASAICIKKTEFHHRFRITSSC